MKKWIRIFVIVSLLLLLSAGCIVGNRMEKKANPERVCDDGTFLSQLVRYGENDYILYKNAEQDKFQVTCFDKDLYQYKTVGTVHLDRVYSIYGYKDENRQLWGIEPVDPKEEEVWQVPVLEKNGTFLAAGTAQGEILVSFLDDNGSEITEYVLNLETEDKEWRESAVFSLSPSHFAVCAEYDNGKLTVAQEDGKIYVRDVIVKEAEPELGERVLSKCFEKKLAEGSESIWRIYCFKIAVKQCAIPVLLVSAFLVLLFFGKRRENHMIYHLISYSEIICMTGLLAAGLLFANKLTKQEIMETGVETGYVLEEMKALQKADGSVTISYYWNLMKNCEGLLHDIIILEPESCEVILAKNITSGKNIEELYGEEVRQIISGAADSNKTVMVKWKEGKGNYAVLSRDFTQIDAKSVLMAVILQEGIETRIEKPVSTIWNVIFMLMAAVTMLHMIIFLVFASRWRKFLEGMKVVACEKQAYVGHPVGCDGLHSAWEPLDRIGHNLVKLRYEKDLLYKNYYRFVPKGMELLLKKTEVADIEIGDTNKIYGCMVHFQMENIKNVSAGEYMELMTESLTSMHQIREKKEGFFISADGDLLRRKVFFETNSREALSFAVELYRVHDTKKKLKDTNVVMMLHTGEYVYGVSGVENLMTPFIYCKEERILDPYLEALAKAKVNVVLTKQTLDAIGEGFLVRYIGFVTGEETQGSIKLYECLDAYSEDKRKIMKESDVFFQKALKLFYSNDFYLARNGFNEVLKMNEQDEIARWYLFHCEYHLNKPEAQVSYGLFENDVQK